MKIIKEGKIPERRRFNTEYYFKCMHCNTEFVAESKDAYSREKQPNGKAYFHCPLCSTTLIAPTECIDIKNVEREITKEQWENAKKHLDRVYNFYHHTGGGLGVIFLMNLKKRYDSGERTLKLYEKMIDIGIEREK